MKYIKKFERTDNTESLVQGAYDDYTESLGLVNNDVRFGVLRSIKRQALSMIKSGETTLSVWREKFKYFPEVLKVLDNIELEINAKKYNL